MLIEIRKMLIDNTDDRDKENADRDKENADRD